MEEKINLLIVEDDQSDRLTYHRYLKKYKDIETIETNNVDDAIALCKKNDIGCVLLDYLLPGLNGLHFLEGIKQTKNAFTPIIMLTSHGSENIAVEAMKAGAMDYLVKDQLTEDLLNRTIRHVIEKNKLALQLLEKTSELELMATTDSLTSLLNRRGFQAEASKRLSEAKRHQDIVCLLFIDLDDFKTVNDRYGHDVGDHLLKHIGHILQKSLRKEDLIGRLGGDEFVVLVSRINNQEAAICIAEKILNLVAKPFRHQGKKLSAQACIGMAFNNQHQTLKKLLKEADKALYSAKRKGEGQYAVFTHDEAK